MFYLRNSIKAEKLFTAVSTLRNRLSCTYCLSNHSCLCVYTFTPSLPIVLKSCKEKWQRCYHKYLFEKHGQSAISNNFLKMKHSQVEKFRISDYDIIGFDLDGTLLRYNLSNMIQLEYDVLIEYLVKVKGYSDDLLKQKLDFEFLQKGLIIDAERGNILKLSADGTILCCTHGTRRLSKVEIAQIYGSEYKWLLGQEFIKDPLSLWNGPASKKIRAFLDYFDYAAPLVFAQTIDILDKKSSKFPVKYNVWSDMLNGLIQMYSRENFSNGRSKYFEALRGNPDRYLLKTDDRVIKWLKSLRDQGKGIYLLTGSNTDFANFTATVALGDNWRNLFDFVVCFAKKPGFFDKRRPFLTVDNNTLMEIEYSEKSLSDILELDSIYTQGNWQQLRDSFNNHLFHKELKDLKSIYIGDNLLQDVFAPARNGIDTIAICEELIADKDTYPYSFIIQSSFWGSYFSINNQPTIWSFIYKKYARHCVACIDELIVSHSV